MALRSSLIFVLLYAFAFASASYHGVSFLFPTDSLTANHDDTVNVTYTSPFRSPLLYTFCRNSTDNNEFAVRQEQVPQFNGSQLVQLIWTNISSCYWDLRPNTSYGYGANSPTVNVLDTAKATPVTLSISMDNSTSATETDSASSDGTPSASDVSSSNSTASSRGGLSIGAKVGIAVGVVIGVIVAALAGFFLLRKRNVKRRGLAPAGPSVLPVYGLGDLSWSGSGQYIEKDLDRSQKPSELSSWKPPSEMATQEVRHELN